MQNRSSLVELLQMRATLQGDQCAYMFTHENGSQVRMTYAQLDQRARAFAAALQQVGKPSERALLLFQPGLDYIVAYWGCLYAGIYAVPAYPPRQNGNLGRLKSIVDDAAATIALTSSAMLKGIQQQFADTPGMEQLRWLDFDEAVRGDASGYREQALHQESIAFLQYTSGSTSAPKGVILTHGNLLANLELIQNTFQTTSESHGVIWLPPYHDMGLIGGILQPIYTGYPMTLMAPVDFITRPVRWLEAISATQATVSGGPNFAYDLCVQKVTDEQLQGLDLSSWEQAFTGAEPIRAQTLDRFAERFAAVGFRREAFYPCYGLAESTLLVTGGVKSEAPIVRAFDEQSLKRDEVVAGQVEEVGMRTLVSSGRPALSDHDVRVVNPQTLTPCTEAEVGEIWVSGPSVARGYWNRPELSVETFGARVDGEVAGPYLRTGDLGFVHQGEIYVTGRLKDLIIIRGRNHYPQDIEFTVQESHPAVRSSNGAAVAVEVDGEERLVIVYEVERAFRKANLQEVAHAIREAISRRHELQTYAIVLIKPTSIPKTSSGKIQRHMCRHRFLEGNLDVLYEDVLGVNVEAAVALEEEISVEVPERAELLAMPEPERNALLERVLLAKVSRALRGGAVQAEQSLAALGFDSLMAVELKQELEEWLGVTIPLTVLIDGQSIREIAQYLLNGAGLEEDEWATLTHVPEAEGVAPQSIGQQTMWFLHRLAPESAAYHVPLVTKIKGALDTQALAQSLSRLMERHNVLRTTYGDVNGQPVQVLATEWSVPLESQDASAWTEEQLRAFVDETIHRPFDLQKGPVFRIQHLKRAENEHLLVLVFHHIAVDLWSLTLLMKEWGLLYAEACGGARADLAELAVTYRDYAHFQQRRMSTTAGEKLAVYWQEQLRGSLPVLALPTDRPRPPVQTYRGASLPFALEPQVSAGIKELAKREGVTLYTLLLSAFQVLLHRYSGQEDILVGSPTAGRHAGDLQGIVGYFVNPVVVRGNLSGNPSFAEFLRQIRKTVLRALEHQEYPFVSLVERLQVERDPSYNPIFQAMFALQNVRTDDDFSAFALGQAGSQANFGGLLMESEALAQRVAQFDLHLSMLETGGGISGAFEYNADLFDPATIERMASHFQVLLNGILEQPEQQVFKLPLLTATERQLIVETWNDTAVDYPQDVCLHHLFEAQVERTPDGVALAYEGTALTYRELNQRANQLAWHLRGKGVGSGVRVLVFMERSLEMVISLYAILKAGGAYVPLDPSYPQDRIDFIAEDAQAALILTQERFRTDLAEKAATLIFVDSAENVLATERDDNPRVDVKATDSSYMIYTSGSTGRPKGVLCHHRGIVNRLLWMQEAYGLTAEDRILQKTPFSFDVSVWEFFWPLLFGARLVVARPGGHQDPAYLVQTIQEQRITVLHFVPSMLQMFLEHPDVSECRTIRHLICSGEALPFELQERLFERLAGVQLHNLYGPTEATVDVTAWTCQREGTRHSVPIGRPIANTEIYLLDTELQPVPIGVLGELHIGGVQVALGYHNRPDLTAERFIPHPFRAEEGARLYKTGDLARFLPDGTIEYGGRIDFQVKVRGFRIELGEIESVLMLHPLVLQAVVVLQDVSGDKRLYAYLLTESGQEVPFEELRTFLKGQLPEYMLPSAFMTLAELPLSPSGKVDRKALPAPTDLQTTSQATYVAPSTPTEETLAAIWAELLQVERVGVEDHFFSIGGHSLLAMQVVSRIRQTYQVDIPVGQMFEAPTIAKLAHLVEESKEQAVAKPTIKRVAREAKRRG